MLIDYQMAYPADVVPRGGRTERRVRATVSNVVEIPDAPERSVSHVLTARTAQIGGDLYRIRDRSALEARIQEMLETGEKCRDQDWFSYRNVLYASAGLTAPAFEAAVIRRAGIHPYNGTAPRQPLEAITRDDVRAWNWDDREGQAASEREWASSHLRDGETIMRKALPPLWTIQHHSTAAAATVTLDLFPSTQTMRRDGFLNYLQFHQLEEAIKRARHFASQVEGCYAIKVANAQLSPGVTLPRIDLEALGLAMATSSLLIELGEQAGRMSIHQIRAYGDIRERAEACFDLAAIDRLGTATDFRRSPELCSLAEEAVGLTDATRAGAKELLTCRRNVADCLSRLERSPHPGPMQVAEQEVQMSYSR